MKRTSTSTFSSPLNLKTLLFCVAPIVLAMAVAPAMVAAPNANDASYDNTKGDFIVGFREVGSTSSILADLGPITGLTTKQTFNVELGSLLSSTYGSDWATNPNVYFSVAATSRPQDTTTFVNYVTSPEYPSEGVQAKIWPRLTQTNSKILQNKIINCGNDFNSFSVQDGTNAVLEPSTSPDAYQNFMPGGTTDAGHAGQANIGWGFFNPTPEGNFQDGAAGVLLHLIQLIPGNGSGNDLGTFVLSADGNTLTFTPNSPPVITSSTAVTVSQGAVFSYQITASNSPTSYAAPGLPTGLTIDTTTGLISGNPKNAGTAAVTISATNGVGTGTARLTITIKAATVPVITSATSANATQNTAFSYEITASNSPTSYAASGLPTGLTINTASGLISGSPKNVGTAAVTISATNAAGTGTARLTISIKAATVPVITSATSANATQDAAFSYQITASNSPTSYAASGLPTGLTVNTTSGLITGAPKNAGTAAVTISATNADGTGSAKVTISIAAK